MSARDELQRRADYARLRNTDDRETTGPRESSVTSEGQVWRWRCTCPANGLELSECAADMAIEAHIRGHRTEAGWFRQRTHR